MRRNPRALPRSRRVVVTLTGVAFAILVSVAATHLHIGPDTDAACAVCAAFTGKLEGPSASPLAAPAIRIVYASPQARFPRSPAAAILVVLPPSCGPPHFA
jgi:hypothetical protein